MARQISEFNRKRIEQGFKLRRLRKSAENVIQAQFQRIQFGIGYYTTKDLQKRGATEEDIIEYYEREMRLLTGQYTIDRNIIAKNNYLKGMKEANMSKDLIDRVDNLLDPLKIKTFRKVFRLLPIIRSYYYKDDSKEEINELLKSTLTVAELINED